VHEVGPRPLRHIGSLRMATMDNSPGLAPDGGMDDDAYPALAEKLGELLHGFPAQLQTDLGVLGWDRTPGLIIDTGPPGFRPPASHP